MKWCKNGVVGIKIEIKGLKKPLITIVSAIEKHKVYKYFYLVTKTDGSQMLVNKMKVREMIEAFDRMIENWKK